MPPFLPYSATDEHRQVRFFYLPFDIHLLEAGGIDSDAINRDPTLTEIPFSPSLSYKHELPKGYYDSFEWKKTYTYNFAQSGGTPILVII